MRRTQSALDVDGDVGRLVAQGIDEIPGAAVLVFDQDLRYVLVRGGAVRDNAIRAEELENRLASDVMPPERWDYLRPMYEEALRGGTSIADVDSADGARHYLIRTAPVRAPSGEVVGGVSVASDVTELRGGRYARGTLRLQASRDPMTGLPDRAGFREGLDRILAHPPRAGRRLALLYLDMDDLKAVNDEHGHAAGDRVLLMCARRIRSLLRTDDLLARFGGDEFVALLTGIRDPSDARLVSEQIHTVVRAPIPLDNGAEVHVSLSIGIAMVDPADPAPTADPGDLAEDAIRRADKGMSRAKAAGGGGTVVTVD